MKRTKIVCEICGREISKSNYSKHLLGHKNNPEHYSTNKYHLDHNDLYCKYCNKLCKNKNSLIHHEIKCSKNPDAKHITNGFNNPGRIAWNKGLTKNTDFRVKKFSDTRLKNHKAGKYDYSHNKHTAETKEKIRQQKLALCKIQGTNLCGKGKRGWYKGYYCQSSWELAYVIYQLEHNIKIIRNKNRFAYILNGIERSYFPDFYLIDTNEYVEIKGYYDTKSKEKEKQFPKDKKLIVLKKEAMKPILEYVINKYGKNFIALYEK